MDDIVDKRSIPRVEVNWPITVFTEQGAIQGETLNITGEGLGIRSDEPLRLNEIYRIFIIPGNEMAIEVRGRVVWSDVYAIDDEDSAVAMGVCFVEINKEDRVIISELAANVD